MEVRLYLSRIGNEKRSTNYKTVSPGPGMYASEEPGFNSQFSTVLSILSKKCKKLGKFGKQMVQRFQEKEKIPGPGDYELKITNNLPSSPSLSFSK